MGRFHKTMPWFFEASGLVNCVCIFYNSVAGQEFLAFAPAFEATFPFGCELPEATSTEETEAPTAPTLEAW